MKYKCISQNCKRYDIVTNVQRVRSFMSGGKLVTSATCDECHCEMIYDEKNEFPSTGVFKGSSTNPKLKGGIG